ncbi:response regulator transcription factor [Vallitalea guaymasensis]|uniref:response regulator transcription factor n=1 Tax=Vallitalea guaymasensis TaxID=1185412 RepID=UPI000DE365BA|nr:response regulator [Vallitalea guaymasensis]
MYKVLIVDDEYEIRKGISNYFPWNEIGFEVIGEAENGREALKIIQKNHVHVVLCDIKMPHMTGIQLAQILYEQYSHIKIVFLSAYKDFEYAKKALVYGVKDYIVKPTKYKELLNVFVKIKSELDKSEVIINKDNPVKDDKTQDTTYHDKMIITIKNITKNNYQNITLQHVADKVNISPSYLSKYFKSKTGENFSDYVLKIKMEKARELLMDIKYKTYEVSELVGYTNPKNFTRAFKKYFGQSPRNYRNGGKK